MNGLKISEDTSLFELPAVLDARGKLTDDCAREAVARIDTYGFVILTNLLSYDEADAALEMVR